MDGRHWRARWRSRTRRASSARCRRCRNCPTTATTPACSRSSVAMPAWISIPRSPQRIAALGPGSWMRLVDERWRGRFGQGRLDQSVDLAPAAGQPARRAQARCVAAATGRAGQGRQVARRRRRPAVRRGDAPGARSAWARSPKPPDARGRRAFARMQAAFGGARHVRRKWSSGSRAKPRPASAASR